MSPSFAHYFKTRSDSANRKISGPFVIIRRTKVSALDYTNICFACGSSQNAVAIIRITTAADCYHCNCCWLLPLQLLLTDTMTTAADCYHDNCCWLLPQPAVNCYHYNCCRLLPLQLLLLLLLHYNCCWLLPLQLLLRDPVYLGSKK